MEPRSDADPRHAGKPSGVTYWPNSNKPKPLPRLKPGHKATRNGEPAWRNAPERLRQSDIKEGD